MRDDKEHRHGGSHPRKKIRDVLYLWLLTLRLSFLFCRRLFLLLLLGIGMFCVFLFLCVVLYLFMCELMGSHRNCEESIGTGSYSKIQAGGAQQQP